MENGIGQMEQHGTTPVGTQANLTMGAEAMKTIWRSSTAMEEVTGMT